MTITVEQIVRQTLEIITKISFAANNGDQMGVERETQRLQKYEEAVWNELTAAYDEEIIAVGEIQDVITYLDEAGVRTYH